MFSFIKHFYYVSLYPYNYYLSLIERFIQLDKHVLFVVVSIYLT